MNSDKPIPRFPGFQAVSDDINSVRNNLRARPLYIDLDLTVARSRAAGTAVTVEFPGNCFYSDQILSTGTMTCYFEDSNFDNTPAGFGVPPGFIAQLPFTRVTFENVAQPGKKAHIIYGIDLQFTPNPNSQVSISGDVNVIDNGKTRTLNNLAFIDRSSVFPGAALYPQVQLWNPGPTHNVYIESIIIAVNTSQNVLLKVVGGSITTSLGSVTSKKGGGGTLPNLSLRTDSSVAAPSGSHQISAAISAASSVIIPLREPLLLPPGFGLLGHGDAANSLLTVTYEGFVEPV